MTSLTTLLQRRVLFFGGKGGVGKTTNAAMCAVMSARSGHRTLLVSTDPAHSTADVLGCTLGPEPTEVAENLSALEIDPEQAADEYIQGVKARIADATPPRLAQEVDRQIDIARVSPGAEDAALFDRFAAIMDEERFRFDRIIFDTAPTGHTIRLLTLPETMADWVAGLISQRKKVNVVNKMWRNAAGAAAGSESDGSDPILDALEDRRERFARARSTITNPVESAFVFVVTPERLPILETKRAIETLERYKVPIGGVIVNRILPADAESDFMTRRHERQTAYLKEIEDAFGGKILHKIPLQTEDVLGVEALARLAATLA